MEEDTIPEPGDEPTPRRDGNGRAEVDRDWEEAWREMGMEEQDESLEQMLATLRERRQQIEAKFPEADVEGVIARLAVRVEEQRRHTARVRETEEAWLQAVADVADAEANLMVMVAEVMKGVEDFTEEQWEALPVGIRGDLMDRLQAWRRDKERFLSQLPIEERRKLE